MRSVPDVKTVQMVVMCRE